MRLVADQKKTSPSSSIINSVCRLPSFAGIGIFLLFVLWSFVRLATPDDVDLVGARSKMAGLLPRMFEAVNDEDSAAGMTVMSFNLLADGLAQGGKFAFAKQENLEWEPRFPLLFAEILRIDPDVGGLQEFNHADDTWTKKLAEEGYSCVYSLKDPSPASRYGKPNDGVAVLFKNDRFELDGEPRTFAKDPVQCIVPLKDKTNPQMRFLFSSHHLKAKRGFEEVRYSQIQNVISRIQTFNAERESGAAIFVGDFNAEPKEKAVAHCKETGFTNIYESTGHGNLWSTWKYRLNPDGKTSYLNKRTIDFIMATPGFAASEILLPPDETAVESTGLPTTAYGSDHIAIAAKLSYR